MARSVRFSLLLAFFVTLVGCTWAFSALPGCGYGAALLMSFLLAAALTACLLPLRDCSKQLLLACALLGALLLMLRVRCFGTETSDYTTFLLPWTEKLRSGGHFRALKQEIGNYNVPYMVLLALFSCFELPPVYPIKAASVLFDLLLAFCAGGLVRQSGGSRDRQGFCFLLTLVLPTVFINGAVWGQCDSIYVSLALLGLLLCLREKPVWGMVAFGVSFAFKLQAIFLLPVVLLLLYVGKVRWYHLPVFPAAYVAAVSPAILAGRGFLDTLLIYVNTASTAGSSLNYNSPSMYSLLYFYRVSDTDAAGKAGILAAFLFCAAVFAFFFVRRKRITDRSLVLAALLFTLALPLFLPHMHDRYFYFVDILTLVLACLVKPGVAAAFFSQFASLLGYHAYFFLRYLYPMRWGFWLLVLVLGYTVFLTVRELCLPDAGVPAKKPPAKKRA